MIRDRYFYPDEHTIEGAYEEAFDKIDDDDLNEIKYYLNGGYSGDFPVFFPVEDVEEYFDGKIVDKVNALKKSYPNKPYFYFKNKNTIAFADSAKESKVYYDLIDYLIQTTPDDLPVDKYNYSNVIDRYIDLYYDSL